MNSRERVHKALHHRLPDRVPLDLGATPVTGMHVSSVYALRQELGLDRPGEPIRVTNIYQMLGEIKPDLVEVLGIDTLPLPRRSNSFGIPNREWKEWRTFDGTPVLVPGGFNTEPEPNGDLLIYPQGDSSVPASGRMPEGGFYFDAIVRQPELAENNLNVDDNLEEFSVLSGDDLNHYREEAERLFISTDKAIIANVGGTGFGDIAHVPGVSIKHPKGIRDIEEWYISIVTRQDYIHEIFSRQSEIALHNLKQFYAAVGDRVAAVFLSGTDFGGQDSLIISPRIYRILFKPYQKLLNDWIHENTGWKTIMHTDGAVRKLVPDFIEAGFDVLNPVQWTAAGMDAGELKDEFGKRLAFWGAGVDTQHTLPFGASVDVEDEVYRMLELFKPGGGFVFSSVHNVQAGVPVENLRVFYETFERYRDYV